MPVAHRVARALPAMASHAIGGPRTLGGVQGLPVSLLLLPRAHDRPAALPANAKRPAGGAPAGLRAWERTRYLPLSLSFDVSAADDEDDELGEDMLLLLEVPPLDVSVEPDVAPELGVLGVLEVADEDVSEDGVVVVDDDDDDGVDGLIVPVVDELELEAGGVVLGVVVVDELELEAGGVVGVVVVVVLDSRLQPAMPIAAAMASTAHGLAFI
jgi:hypothetical protein